MRAAEIWRSRYRRSSLCVSCLRIVYLQARGEVAERLKAAVC